MKELESMLDSNTTEAEIKAALDKVCSILPKTISDDVSYFMIYCYCNIILNIVRTIIVYKLLTALLKYFFVRIWARVYFR